MLVHFVLVRDERNEFSRIDLKETLQGFVSFVFWYVSLTDTLVSGSLSFRLQYI